jgi:MEDS: MEthanogen/methylotroph, DcmR Sensory domain
MLAGLDEAAASDQHEHRITRLWSNQEWCLGGLPGCQDLVEYECRFNEIWPKYNDVYVCAYDATMFRADTLTNVLRAHPFAIVGGILRENPFYVPPREMLEELRGSSAVPRKADPALLSSAEGMAALSICESILLTLNDLKIVSEEEARNLLTDVATAHQEAAVTSLTPDRHQAVVDVVHRILAGRNGVRH